MVDIIKAMAQKHGFVRSRIAIYHGLCYLMVAMPYRWSSRESRRYFGLFACHDNYALAVKKLKIVRTEVAALMDAEPKKMVIFCNSSLDEKQMAHQCGLGSYGKNSLILVPNWGSFVVIAALQLPLLLPPDDPLGGDAFCLNCSICQQRCPTKALESPYHLIKYRCAQQWASTGQQPPPFFEKKASKIIYGCDLCQLGCPLNQKALQFYSEAMEEEDEEWTDISRWLAADQDALRQLVKKSPMRFNWLDKVNLQKNAKRLAKREEQQSPS